MCVCVRHTQLATALKHNKPVIMLCGASDADGGFVPNKAMLENMYYMVDVSQAAATVEEDRTRILTNLSVERGGVGIEAVNSLARGAITGAYVCMDNRAVLASAAGNDAPLSAVRGKKALGEALRAAAAGGALSVRLLPCALFPNGFRYASDAWRHAQSRTPVLVHNNWIKGHEAKLERFKRWGLWHGEANRTL